MALIEYYRPDQDLEEDIFPSVRVALPNYGKQRSEDFDVSHIYVETDPIDAALPNREGMEHLTANARRLGLWGLHVSATTAMRLAVFGVTVLPPIFFCASVAALILTGFFLLRDSNTWAVAMLTIATLFAALFVVGVKLFIDLRRVTHGFRTFSRQY